MVTCANGVFRQEKAIDDDEHEGGYRQRMSTAKTLGQEVKWPMLGTQHDEHMI